MTACALGDFLGDAVLVVVLEIVVGVGGDLGVGGGQRVADRGRQAGVGLGAEEVLQAVDVAGLPASAGGVVAVVGRVEDIAAGVLDLPGLKVARVAVGLGAVVVGVDRLADGGPRPRR